LSANAIESLERQNQPRPVNELLKKKAQEGRRSCRRIGMYQRQACRRPVSGVETQPKPLDDNRTTARQTTMRLILIAAIASLLLSACAAEAKSTQTVIAAKVRRLITAPATTVSNRR
jgi:hypothetical protein